jgi:hypothetical protein
MTTNPLEQRLEQAYEQLLDTLVDPRDAWYDDDGSRWVSLGAAGEGRDCVGVAYRTETELADIRTQCRALAVSNEYAINGHENRINYIVGYGHNYRAVPRKHTAAPVELAAEVQGMLDEFIRQNQWHRRQQELLLRLDRDGEALLRFFTASDGTTRVRFVEPAQVSTPQDRASDPQHSFGIHTDRDDVETVFGYWIDGQYVEAGEIQHRKANVDQNVKRGLPLFYPVRKNLRRAEKLLRNMSVVAEIQSAIALIRRHRTGNRAAMQQFIQQQADGSTTAPGSTRPTPVKRYGPGTILDAHADVDYEFPAAALDASSFVTVLQAELRAIAARLVMPEFMLTSDASNANFSSTMIAEGPAVRMFERWQKQLIDADLHVMRRVIDNAMSAGRLPQDAWPLIEIQAVAPSVHVRDRLQEAKQSEIEFAQGVLSRQTWCQRSGLDFDQEQANRAQDRIAS